MPAFECMWGWGWPCFDTNQSFLFLWKLCLKNTSLHKENMIYIIKRELGLYQNKVNSSLPVQAYFGWAKRCLCCSRHLWFYNSGRLGRVEIVTLKVGARALPPRSLWPAPFPPLFGKFQHGAFASKLHAQRKCLHCRLGQLQPRFHQ